MEFKTLKYDVTERIATITLNKPDKMNAFSNQMCQDIVDALDLCDNDDEVRVVIFTGEGRAFCAGFDLDGEFSPFGIDFANTSIYDHRDPGGIVALRLYEMKKPVIAAINGAAVGVGITMTLSMDIRIMSERAKLGFVFAKRGIVNEACSGWFLPRIVGMSKAMEWVATGRLIEAQEALESGLVSYVVPKEDVYSKAVAIAKEIVANTAPVSVALARQLMYKMQGEPHPMLSNKLESMLVYWCGTSKDAKEGVDSFFEKREPNYNMKPSTEMPDFYPWWEKKSFPKTN